jgi:hypothetical protein
VHYAFSILLDRALSNVNSLLINPFGFARMAELEEGTGTEASDSQLLEKLDSDDSGASLRYVVNWAFCFGCDNYIVYT